MLWNAHTRRAAALLIAAALVFGGFAPIRAADQTKEEEAGVKELRALLSFDPKPKTKEEFLAKLREVLPKVQALAEKYAKNRAGARALATVVQISLRLEDEAGAVAALETFISRYPKDPNLAAAKFFLGRLKYYTQDYAGAKQVLTALLKEHPNVRFKAQVEALLKKANLIGSPAKNFKTKDLAGKPVQLSDFRGKIVILDFYAGWCRPCVREMPNLKKLYATYRGRGLEIVGVSLDRSLADAQKYVKKADLPWVITWEKPGFWDSPVAVLYGVRSIPATYLLDRQGKVLHTGLRGERLARELTKLFPEEKKEPQPK